MKKIVFTNGCFDIIHPGHIALLEKAKSFGDKLIVGINSDKSVSSIKGKERPINSEKDRAAVLMGLSSVDEVRIYEELTPENLIKVIKPNVLVKGGDWKKSEIIGADFVELNGGEVHSLPLLEGFSTTKIIDKLRKNENSETSENNGKTCITKTSLSQHQKVFEDLFKNHLIEIEECAEIIYEAISRNNKILICGNGGSASDAQHFAAEFVGRFETERKALAAIALTTDTSAITALANDYGFERIFSRQVEALANKDDVLIAISTSGNSPNVIEAIMSARRLGCKIIGLTGGAGKKLASLSDACLVIPSERTARIQEAHITIIHIWCEIVDSKLKNL